MTEFTQYVEAIKAAYKKEELKTFDSIKPFESLQLAELGSNDVEGFQVFTPQFIVKQMSQAVGDAILDSQKTVLEPTSGDGAFTTYILRARLDRITENFEIESLKALSTIYSIEMDKQLIEKQRNNILTVIKLLVAEKGIEVSPSYYEMVRCIIAANFMWAMFNSDFGFGGGLAGVDVAYKMPEAEKGKLKSLPIPVWSISESGIFLNYDEVSLW